MTAMTARRTPASIRARRARRCAALVIARFQGDNGGRASGERPGGGQGLGFRVRFAFALVISLADDPALRIEQDAADRRIRARRAEAGGGQGDGAPHRGDFGRRGHQASEVSARTTWSRATASMWR